MTPHWAQPDGTPISCPNKLKLLEENHRELAQVMQDAFDDAVLMGVDSGQMRTALAALVAALHTPIRAT